MNQPLFCPDASWNSNASIFANETIVGPIIAAMFINRNDTLVAANSSNGQLLIWPGAHTTVPTIIPANLSSPQSLFVTDDDEIFVDSYQPRRIERWSLKNHSLLSSIPVDEACNDVFVVDDDVYCSQMARHQVVKYSRRYLSAQSTIVAGNGFRGSTSLMLNQPHGIFVTRDIDLYVADYWNARIQKFRSGEWDGTTVAGDGTTDTISLSYPTDVTMDGGGYLFIADSGNLRIVGSDANGYRCVVGCDGIVGSSASKFSGPLSMTFDSHGNLYVVDAYDFRIQRFALESDGCSKWETYYCSL